MGTWCTLGFGLWQSNWYLSSVYGPQGDDEKLLFPEEMTTIREAWPGKWMITGDFNLIASAVDKNNARNNRWLMNTSIISELGVTELRQSVWIGCHQSYMNWVLWINDLHGQIAWNILLYCYTIISCTVLCTITESCQPSVIRGMKVAVASCWDCIICTLLSSIGSLFAWKYDWIYSFTSSCDISFH